MKTFLRATAAGALFVFITPAFATLIGDTININHFVIQNSFSIFNQNVVVVDPGAEVVNPQTLTFPFILNVGASNVTIDYTQSTSTLFAQRIILSGLDWIGQAGFITGVTPFANNPLIDAGGFAFNAITSFTTNSLTIDLIGSDLFGGVCTVGCFHNPLALIGFNIQTSHVLEPTTLALMSLGLLGLGFSRRRNQG